MMINARNTIFGVLIALSAVVTGADAEATGFGWVLTSDFSTFGRLRSFDATTPWTIGGDRGVTPGDAVGREHKGLLYVVGRGGSSVLQVYDPAADFALIHEFSLGAGRNPQDIAFDSQDRAFVSCYDQAVLLRVDVANETVAQTWSTAAFADADGLPETAWMLARGDRLFIACQRLDRNNWYAPTGPGKVLVFDMAAGTWIDTNPAAAGIQAIELVGANPYTRIESFGSGDAVRLRIGCVGTYGALDGGIEEIDPATLRSTGYLTTEQQLGGDVNAFVSTGPDRVYVVVSDILTFDTSLRRRDLPNGPTTVVRPGQGFVFADLAWNGACQLYLADRTLGADGLRVFDSCTGVELTTTALATGLPPFGFIVPGTGAATTVPGIPEGVLRLAEPFPNPCNPSARLSVEGRPGERVSAGIYDLRGRRLSGRHLDLDQEGRGELIFDGLASNGTPLAAGVYRVQVMGTGGSAARSVTLLK